MPEDTALSSSTALFSDTAMPTDKESGGADVPEETDVVDWDGPGDIENPMNWPKGKRLGHVALVSIINFLVSVLE